jgi:hypothetical protein
MGSQKPKVHTTSISSLRCTAKSYMSGNICVSYPDKLCEMSWEDDNEL